MELPEEVRLFLVEAYENLDQVEIDLVELEKDPQNSELLNSVFRAIHTIKGNSGETLLDQLRSNRITLNPDITTVLLEFNDTVRRILENIENTAEEGQIEISELKQRLSKFIC